MKCADISDLCLSDGPAVADWRFAIYFPLGILVLLARVVIILLFALASFLIPARWRRTSFRVFRLLLGVVVRRNMTPEAAACVTRQRIIVSNHVSMLDAFATLDVGEPVLLRGTALRGDSRWTSSIFRLVERLSGARFISYEDKRGLANLFRSWREGQGNNCLYVPAEMTINNGRGLFRFNPALLSRGLPVVPQALRLNTSLGLVAHPFLSGGLATLARLLMLPFVTFEVAVLPALDQSEAESAQEFADRVQRAIADHLDIPATRFTVADKHAYRSALRSGQRLGRAQ